MRPDKRSLSFTWFRGQPQRMTAARFEQAAAAGQGSSTSTAENVTSVEPNRNEAGAAAGSKKSRNCIGIESGGGGVKYTSGSFLRRFGSSLTRLGTQYSAIGEEDVEGDDHAPAASGPIEETVVKSVGCEELPVQLIQVEECPIDVDDEEDENEKENPRDENNPDSLSLRKRINKKVEGMKSSFENFSQKFKKSSRRYRIEDQSPISILTPTTKSRRILGRTPTKLYSPFAIETPTPSPYVGKNKTPNRRLDHGSTPRLYKKRTPARNYSPGNTFHHDLRDARKGLEELNVLSRNIARRSVRF